MIKLLQTLPYGCRRFISLKDSLIPRFLFTIFILFVSFQVNATAITWTGTTSTDWGTAGNWSGNVVPVSTDAVTIPTSPSGGRMPTLSTGTFTISTLAVQTGATLTISGGTLNVTGVFTPCVDINAGGTLTQSGGTLSFSGGTTNINGIFNQSAGTYLGIFNFTINSGGILNQSGTGLIHMATNTATSPTDNFIIASGGVANQSGGTIYTKDYAATNLGTFNQTGSSAIFKIFHDWKVGAGNVFNSTAGTVEFAGTAAKPDYTIGSLQFNNILIDAGVDPMFSYTLGATLNISGDFTNNNSTLAAQTSIGLNFNGTGTQIFYTAAPANTIATSVNINKTSGTLSLGSGVKVGTLTLTSGNFTTSTNNYSITTTGNVAFNGGSFNANASTISVTGNWTNAGCTITGGACSVTVSGDMTKSAGSTSAPTGSFTLSGNFVNNDSGTFDWPLTLTGTTKTISGNSNFSFNTLIIGSSASYTINISGSCGTLSFNSSSVSTSLTIGSTNSLTINGNLTIQQPTNANIQALNVNAGSVIVNGNVSLALNINSSGSIGKIVITSGSLTVNGDINFNCHAATAGNGLINMSGGSGNLYLTGNLNLINGSGTLTPGTTSTFTYNGTGNQTVAGTSAISYNHLTINKSSGTATLNAAETVNDLNILQGTLNGAGYTITLNGNFLNNATLSGTPSMIFSGASKTISGSTGTAAFGSITFTTGASYSMSSGTYSGTSLTFNANATAITFTQASPSVLAINGIVTINQPTASSITTAWNINDATATATGLITFAGTNTTTSRIGKIVITTGTLNAYGGITFTASANATKVIDMSGGAGTLNLKGALTVPALSGTLTAGTSGSIFNYADDVSAQTVNYFPAGAYHNLHINTTGSTGAALSAAITTANVTGNLRVLSGTLSNATFAIALTTGKTFEVANGATFKMTGTTGMVTGTTITKTFGATGTCDYAGAAQTVSLETYGNLSVSGSGVKTMPGSAMTIQGNFTTSGTVTPTAAVSLTIGGNVILGSGTTLDEGSTTHNIAGNWTNNGATITIGTSTLNFNGTAAQTLGGTVASLTMYNLTISNTSAAVTVNLNTSVSNTLNLNGSSTVLTPAAAVIISGAGTLTGSGTAQVTRTVATPDFCSQYTITNKTLTNLTIDYSALADQTICSATYGNLKAGGSGTKTASGAVTVNGTLNIISGIVVDMATNALSGTLTTITGTGTLKTQNTSAAPVPTGKTWTFTVEYSKTTGAQTVMAATYTNLTNSNTSGSNTVSGDISVSTGLILNSSSLLDMSTFALSGALSNISGTGTLKTQNTSATPIPTGKTWTGSVYYNSASGQTIVNGNYTSLDGTGGNRTLNNSGTIGISSSFTTGSGTYTVTGSTVDFNGNGAQNIPAFTFNNLTTSGSGTTKTATGAVAVNGTLNVSSNVILDMSTYALSGTLTSITGTGILKTQNTSSAPIPSGKTWTGDVYYNSTSAQTIVLGNYNNLDGTGGNRTLLSGTTGISGTFTVGSGTYTVTGSTIDFNGSGAQNIPAFTFENITLSGGNTKTVAGSVAVSAAFTLSANTTLALGSNNITLTSTSSGTARVATVAATASVTYGTGKFIVQRYIQGRRKYRLMTSPVTTSSSSTLSAGQEALSIWGNWQNQGNNGTGNVGTIITGGTSADGFDQQTTNTSLYTYDGINRRYVGFSTANGKNTKYTPLKAGVCYYMFVYGDRINAVSASTPNYTVLSAGGTILTGDQTYNTASAIPLTNTVGNYTMLGNPFASPIDWATVTKTNLYSTYWGWDPNLSSTGGYVTVNTTGTVTLISPFTGTTGLNQYIQSGQGFFVRTSATSPVLTIKESDKVSNNNNNAFRTNTTISIPLIAINLYDNNTQALIDGTLAAFANNFSNQAGNEDASKLSGSAEVVAIENGSELLSIDARQIPQSNDTLSLKFLKLTKPQYTLQIFTNAWDGTYLPPYLTDSYLNTTQALSLNDTNRIVFNVTTDPASFNADRFKIVFSAKNILPVNINTAKAELKVFPNPVKNQQINFQMNELEKGEYILALINSQGQQIVNRSIIHQGGSLNQIMYPDKKLPAGIYYLKIANKNSRYSKTVFIE